MELLDSQGIRKIFYNDLDWDEKTIDCINAIDHILAEGKENKKRTTELEKENKEILNSKISIDLSYDDYIPKQKVKDILLKYKYVSINDTKGIVQFYQEFKKLVEDK